MHLDRVALDLAQDVEQVAGVEADLEIVGSVIRRQLLGRDADYRQSLSELEALDPALAEALRAGAVG